MFEACYEIREAFELLLRRPDKLVLVTGELWPSTERAVPLPVAERTKDDDSTLPGEAVMEGVEHLGQYVYEMTNTRLEQLKKEGSVKELTAAGEEAADNDMEAEEQDGSEAESDGRVEGFEAEEEDD